MIVLLVMPLVLLLLALCAIGTAVSLRCWPFFTQPRVGRRGEVFRFVKIRTLPSSASPEADKYEIELLPIPAFSRALRHLHLDELPQLLLVLTGRMSLVGPRPEMPYLVKLYDRRFAAARSAVRPGCTGLWQIGSHCQQMIYEHPEFDEVYLRSRSLRLDAWIMLRTVRLLLPGRHRHLVTLAELPAWAGSGALAPVADPEATDPLEPRLAEAEVASRRPFPRGRDRRASGRDPLSHGPRMDDDSPALAPAAHLD